MYAADPPLDRYARHHIFLGEAPEGAGNCEISLIQDRDDEKVDCKPGWIESECLQHWSDDDGVSRDETIKDTIDPACSCNDRVVCS